MFDPTLKYADAIFYDKLTRRRRVHFNRALFVNHFSVASDRNDLI